MLTPTHLVTAQALYLTTCVSAGHTPTIPEAAVSLVACLLPDLDSRQSLVGRLVPFASISLEHHFGHRTITHSVLVQAIAGILAYLFLPFGLFLAIVAGWVSHSLADMMTPSGVAWFWPSRVRCVLPGNVKYRMKIMGWGELAFAGLMGIAGVVLMLLAQAGEGTGGLIKAAIGDIASARHQYDAQKGTNAWSLRIEGRDNRSFEEIDGEFPVIGPTGENGFIVSGKNGPVSVCKTQTCDWYADHAVLVKGKAETTTTYTLERDRLRVGSLLESLEGLQLAGEVYLVGELEAKGIEPTLPTVVVSGERISLHYASTALLAGWHDVLLKDVDLSIQVRHEPDSAVPDYVEPGASTTGIDPLLNKWLTNQ